jgi:hypothetical protein
MSKKVTIPTDGGNPFVIIHNGVKYIYRPGETVTVSDGVALEIEEWKRWREKYRNDDDDLLGDVVKTVNGVKPDKNGNVDLDDSFIEAEKAEIFDHLNKLAENDKVLSARMDSFTALPEGSTTGDAELIDGRVDKDGVTHPNIGEHIRNVTGQLSEEIDEQTDRIDDINSVFESVNKYNAVFNEYGKYFVSDGTTDVGETSIINNGYIPIENGEKYSWNHLHGLLICTYDKDKNFIARLTPYVTPSYTSTIFNEDVAFVRLGTYNATFPEYFVFTNGNTFNVDGKSDSTIDEKIAWFGDSISQLRKLPHRVGDLLKVEVNDCSFAGGVMCSHGNETYRNLGFAKLVESIIDRDFTAQEAAITTIETSHGSPDTEKRENLATLQSLDFSEITSVVVLYGTNDWGNNNASIADFKTMMENAISAFLTAFPHIQMYFISPIWRGDGDEKLSNMQTLYDVVEAERDVCNSFNIPFYDLYKNCGINHQTKGYYLGADELHQTINGDIMLANKCAKFLMNN